MQLDYFALKDEKYLFSIVQPHECEGRGFEWKLCSWAGNDACISL